MSIPELIDIVEHVFVTQSGLGHLGLADLGVWVLGLFCLWLAVAKRAEPLLLVPIAFGMLAANMPLAPLFGDADTAGPLGLLASLAERDAHVHVLAPLVFLGLGAMTDCTPLIASPRALAIGIGAQLGAVITVVVAGLLGFTGKQAAAIGILGNADPVTSTYLSGALAPELLGPAALGACLYTAMAPALQPSIMRMLTSPAERKIRMASPRTVSRIERIVFPVVLCLLLGLLVPAIAPLVGMFALGNLLRELESARRLATAAAGPLASIATLLLGLTVGSTLQADLFADGRAFTVILLGVVDFALCTAGGIWIAQVLNKLSPLNLVNPLIGAAGASALPVSARVCHEAGTEADPTNSLIDHAMGSSLAGVFGAVVAAGVLIAMFT